MGEFEFLEIDEEKKEIIFVKETSNVKKDLIIPSGYKVMCGAGKKIYLHNRASIISYSPFYFEGEKKRPIHLSSPSGTGAGLAIIKASETSVFKNVVFDNLSNPQKDKWQLTGAVTMYESDVVFEGCHFRENRCEDALNTIRNEFTIVSTEFYGTQGDSFDADFCKGKIENSKFTRCGNDCIDVSGTNLQMKRVDIERCGDKGVSAGENSRIRAKDTTLRRCMIGMAGKDMSEIYTEDMEIENTKIGLCGYQKKPEFGPSKINARSTKIKDVDLPWLVEDGSLIVLNGKEKRYVGKSKQKQIFKRLKNGQRIY